MKRIGFFLYGAVTYLFFFATFCYLAGFIGDAIVPKSVSTGTPGPVATAILVNLSLIVLFGIQHTIMARISFKQWWAQFVPQPIERTTFVLITSVIFNLMFFFWQPLPGVIWSVDSQVGIAVLWGLFALGWLIVLASTFLINHFDLFGLRQVWLYLRGKEYTPLKFKKAGLYKYVRHPLMLGFLIAMWAVPTMTASHLMFAATMTLYIFLGVMVEEKTLVKLHGDSYRQYQKSTPGFFPLPGKKNSEDLSRQVGLPVNAE